MGKEVIKFDPMDLDDFELDIFEYENCCGASIVFLFPEIMEFRRSFENWREEIIDDGGVAERLTWQAALKRWYDVWLENQTQTSKMHIYTFILNEHQTAPFLEKHLKACGWRCGASGRNRRPNGNTITLWSKHVS